MEVDENGKIRKTLLIVTMEQSIGEEPKVFWTFPEKQNIYFMIGVLHDIQVDLSNDLEHATDEFEGD